MRIGLAIVVATTTSAAAGPRAGHVVRVERALQRATGVPRFCVMQAATGLHGLCLGPLPRAGDMIELLDDSHHVGTARISHVDPNKCKSEDVPSVWQVQAEIDGDLDGRVDTSKVFGVIDVRIDPRRAHLRLDEHAPGMPTAPASAVGIDANGDDHSDVVFALGQCDEANGPSLCFDVWTDPDGHSMQRARHDVIPEGCL